MGRFFTCSIKRILTLVDKCEPTCIVHVIARRRITRFNAACIVIGCCTIYGISSGIFANLRTTDTPLP